MTAPAAASRKLTYADYLTWHDDKRWELIDGVAYDMSPAPAFRHQLLVSRFVALLTPLLAGGRCRAVVAPCDVRLTDHDVVQPDVMVVCAETPVVEGVVTGPPRLVVEILSPATARRDRIEKKALYERAGVREYVMADPDARYVERYTLDADGHYGAPEVLGEEHTLVLHVLDGIELEVAELFVDLEPPLPAAEPPAPTEK